MNVDVIIISDAKTAHLSDLTEQTIQTLRTSEKHVNFRLIVVEKQRKAKYMRLLTENDKIIQQPQQFNYNKCLNMGLKHSTADYIILANNDLIFESNWFSKIIVELKGDIMSASPMGKDRALVDMNNLIGYDVRKHIFGWCIVIKKEVIEKIDSLDERNDFWGSDNIYAKQLKENNILHTLVPESRVWHLESETLNTLDIKKIRKYQQWIE